MELYISTTLVEEGEFPTWRERMLADREHSASAAKAQLLGLFLPHPPARTASRNVEDNLAGDFAFLDRDISDIDLTVRAHNTLRHAGLHTLRDIITRTEGELRRTKNFGEKTLAEIKLILDSMGLGFGMSFDPEDGRLLTSTGGHARLILPPRPDDTVDDDDDDDDLAFLDRPVTHLELAFLAFHGNWYPGVRTLGDLIRITGVRLIRTKGTSTRALTEVEHLLASMNLDFHQSPDSDRCLLTRFGTPVNLIALARRGDDDDWVR